LALCLGIVFDHTALAESPAGGGKVLAYHDVAEQAVDLTNQPETIFLPTGDLFRPLLADPKEPRFYLSYRIFKYQTDKIHAATGGYGEIFGLYRHVNTAGGYSWQANFGGGIHAQFDLHAPSLDLVNTDYIIGFPFSFRKGAESYRITLYHQSSHLGDEFLLHNNIQRVELSYEALDVLGSYEWKKWRVYYGGAYMVHKEPSNLKPATLHGGVEYYAAEHIIGTGRLVGGWDLKSEQEHDWSINSSVKFGLQFDGSTPNGRYIRVLAEGYQGFAPYGQFFSDRIIYAGIGVYLGFE
ncbi:MAG: DUF1207 domain-containing protein, partial [Betaproteobacteria bacterium]